MTNQSYLEVRILSPGDDILIDLLKLSARIMPDGPYEFSSHSDGLMKCVKTYSFAIIDIRNRSRKEVQTLCVAALLSLNPQGKVILFGKHGDMKHGQPEDLESLWNTLLARSEESTNYILELSDYFVTNNGKELVPKKTPSKTYKIWVSFRNSAFADKIKTSLHQYAREVKTVNLNVATEVSSGPKYDYIISEMPDGAISDIQKSFRCLKIPHLKKNGTLMYYSNSTTCTTERLSIGLSDGQSAMSFSTIPELRELIDVMVTGSRETPRAPKKFYFRECNENETSIDRCLVHETKLKIGMLSYRPVETFQEWKESTEQPQKLKSLSIYNMRHLDSSRIGYDVVFIDVTHVKRIEDYHHLLNEAYSRLADIGNRVIHLYCSETTCNHHTLFNRRVDNSFSVVDDLIGYIGK